MKKEYDAAWKAVTANCSFPLWVNCSVCAFKMKGRCKKTVVKDILRRCQG